MKSEAARTAQQHYAEGRVTIKVDTSSLTQALAKPNRHLVLDDAWKKGRTGLTEGSAVMCPKCHGNEEDIRIGIPAIDWHCIHGVDRDHREPCGGNRDEHVETLRIKGGRTSVEIRDKVSECECCQGECECETTGAYIEYDEGDLMFSGIGREPFLANCSSCGNTWVLDGTIELSWT